jgi:hypothetical protein
MAIVDLRIWFRENSLALRCQPDSSMVHQHFSDVTDLLVGCVRPFQAADSDMKNVLMNSQCSLAGDG